MIKNIFFEISYIINTFFDYLLRHSPDGASCYYIYGAMAQISGALLVLVTIYVILRIQMQSENVKNACSMVSDFLSISHNISRPNLSKRVLEYLQKSPQTGDGDPLDIERLWDDVLAREDILSYITRKGKTIIFCISALFLYYAALLHICNLHFLFTLPALILGIAASVFVIIDLVVYLSSTI